MFTEVYKAVETTNSFKGINGSEIKVLLHDLRNNVSTNKVKTHR